MTIFHFRRPSSKHSSIHQAPVLEASTFSSQFMLTDFHNKQNVNVIEEDLPIAEASSTSSTFSNDENNSPEEDHRDNKDKAAQLSQAMMEDYQVKLDEKDENVVVSMEMPTNTPVVDLTVQVDHDGILRVTGEILDDSSSRSNDDGKTKEATTNTKQQHRRRNSVEQAFQLDEQSLDIDQMTANLSEEGVLTITAPKKPDDAPAQEPLPIQTHTKPPRLLSVKDAFRLIVDLPGVPAEDICVVYAHGKLRVSANRHFGHVRSFKRTIPVDTTQFDVTAEPGLQVYLYRGQLTVLIPPKDAPVARPHRVIEIQTPPKLAKSKRRMAKSVSTSSMAVLEEGNETESLSSRD